MSEVKLYSVPDGYALVSVDALRAWGKLGEVKSACGYPAALSQPAPSPQPADGWPGDYLLVIKSLGAALRRLTLVARTSGGVAGHDPELVSACEQAEQALTMRGIAQAVSQPAAPVVSDGVTREQINALLNDDSQDSKEMHDFARAILALRPQTVPTEIPMPSLDINSPTASYSPVVTLSDYEQYVLIQALNCYLEDWADKQRVIATYTPSTPPAIECARDLLVRLRSELRS